ncbi:MAG TPA: hypothetical protein VHZ95_07590 [Polyangiales bacterium]|nr:hypothetical protein [Polyangiales bacterium]
MTEVVHVRSARRWERFVCAGVVSLASLTLAADCNGETVFASAFDSNDLGSPPAHAQSTGTIALDGPSGSVTVVSAPGSATGRWAKITRASSQTSVTAMQCNLSEFGGDGTFGLLAVLYIPTGAQVATLQFESFGQAASNYGSFLHLDFLQNNTVRFNDEDSSAFGSFPRDQAFTVSITLTITASSASAHVDLLGGASGSADHAGTPVAIAQQFGAVRFWMGYPWTGSFYVNDVIVTRQTQ